MEQNRDEKQGYITPPEIWKPAKRFFQGIALDPCASRSKYASVQAKKKLFEDGDLDYFSGNWKKLSRGGLVFVNPEYSDMLTWMDKVCLEAKRGTEILALVPARVDTEWWHEYVDKHFNWLIFWRGRISFIDPDTGKSKGAGKFPSALVYYGPRSYLATAAYEGMGAIHYGFGPR